VTSIRDATPSTIPPDLDQLARMARAMLDERRLRDASFDPAMFTNPAWDVLLLLYVAGSEGRALMPLDVCETLAVPQATMLRWLAYLADKQLIVDAPDPTQRGSSLVRLSATGRQMVSTYLDTVARHRHGEAAAI
jgi:DNA-binding MarR family transcriptional regulator